MAEQDLKNMSSEQIASLQRQNCVFCKIISGEIPSKNVHSDNFCFATLDINPANEGHILLLPKEHYQIMPQVPDEVLSHMFMIAKKISRALLMSTVAKSTSIFVANGAAAGQKAPHFMIHIIPRKTPDEFFVIPSKEASGHDLEALRKAVVAKISSLTGYAPQQKEIHPPPKQPDTNDYQEKNLKQPPPMLDGRKIAKLGIKKEPGYLYYIDEDGDIARVPMARGKRKGEKVRKASKKEKQQLQENDTDIGDGDTSSKPTLDDISRMLLGERR